MSRGAWRATVHEVAKRLSRAQHTCPSRAHYAHYDINATSLGVMEAASRIGGVRKGGR